MSSAAVLFMKGHILRDQRATKVSVSMGEKQMSGQFKAIAFDVDASSLLSLRKTFPKWEIQVVHVTTTASLPLDLNLGAPDLLVVGSREDEMETLSLCRRLRSQAGWSDIPLLALVPSATAALVKDVLEAGANSCLILPIHAEGVASMLVRAQAGNQPGRHTLNLSRAQTEDSWRDDGGQG
jgi:PleD family two-component response regulator